MMLLPKGLAPKFEINDMKTRKEVLGEWSTSKYSSEKRAETKMVESVRSNYSQRQELKNKNLFAKVKILNELGMHLL